MLLTRSPLEYPRKGLSARLACVKHAASVRPEPGSNSPLNDSHPDPKARENKPPSHRASMTVNRQQALLGRRTRHDGGSTYINALAFNTLLSSQETRTRYGTNKQAAVGATIKPYSGVSFMSTKFPEAFRDVAQYRDPPITPQLTSASLTSDTRPRL